LTFFQPGASEDDNAQPCPICGVGQPESSCYPNYLCRICAAKAADEDGRRLSFSNTDIGGAFITHYKDTGEERRSNVCYVNGVRCFADEAKFGGIVIEPEE